MWDQHMSSDIGHGGRAAELKESELVLVKAFEAVVASGALKEYRSHHRIRSLGVLMIWVVWNGLRILFWGSYGDFMGL